MESADPVRDAHAIVEELHKYDESLYLKPRWLVLNKIDLIPEAERAARVQAFTDAYFESQEQSRPPVFAVAAINGTGCDALVFAVMDFVQQAAAQQESAAEAGVQ
jgi:GTP-binding protein